MTIRGNPRMAINLRPSNSCLRGFFSRMKNHRRLNDITVEHSRKVTVHSLIPVIVTQAMALAFPDTLRERVA